MATYRPSCVVHFKLRFDEALTLVPESGAPEKLFTPARAPKPGPSAASSPDWVNQAGQGVEDSWVFGVVPRELSLEKPGYRQFGSFNMSVAFRDLPIDPRTVRAAAVEIHLGTVSDEDFAQGFSGPDAQGRIRSVLLTRTDDGQPNSETLRMVGMVDEWDVQHTDKGSIVTCSGRDLRGVLIDTPIGPDDVKDSQLLDAIDWSQPIDQVVAQVLAFNPFFAGFNVVCNPADWDGGVIPSPGLDKGGVARAQRGARAEREHRKVKPPADSSNLNFWDVITRACYLVGAIPTMRHTDIVLRPARTVYDRLRGSVDPARNPTPFADGARRYVDAESGETLRPPLKTRRLVYGRDVGSLNLNRKFAGWRKTRIVRCVSLDLDAPDHLAQLVQGFWPPDVAEAAVKKARATSKKAAGSNKSKEDVITVPVPGVKDPAKLELIAHSIYEELGRGELGGAVKTKALASFGGDNSDPDLLRLDPGDGVEILTDLGSVRSGIAPVVSTVAGMARMSYEQAVADVARRLGNSPGDRRLAEVIVATARGLVAELQSFYRVQTVKLAWDSSDGVVIEFDFQNYVVARAQLTQASAADGATAGVAVQDGAAAKASGEARSKAAQASPTGLAPLRRR